MLQTFPTSGFLPGSRLTKLTVLAAAGIISMITLASTDAGAQQRPHFLDNDVHYVWPTNASRYMSSSFGETRAAHFHAAMDIGTWGHEGYAVYAARDGIVERVAVGPVGYGNVIYLRHDDGSISLYAHLKDFHPRIRSVVDSLRLIDYRFEFDSNLESFDIRFRAGRQIGWTGSTGVGPPHLHFELRTPDGRPFNPFLAGLRIEDTIPPQFSELAIEPLSANSRINGRPRIFRIRPSIRAGEYHFGSIDVQGETGLAVDVFDRANASNNVHAVYELQMFVNDELFFHSRVDSFSYNETRQMFLDRVYPVLAQERKGFQRLYVRQGNTLSFYRNTGHDGRLNLPPGIHDIRIEASDFFGNRSHSRLTLHVTKPDSGIVTLTSAPPGDLLPQMSRTGRRNTSATKVPENLIWHKNWVRPNPEDDSTVPAGGISLQPMGSFSGEMKRYATIDHGLPLDIASRKKLWKGDKSWTLHRIDPENPVSLFYDNMRISLHFPVDAFFEPVSIGVIENYPDFTIFPDIEPFQNQATVIILLDEKLRKKQGIGVYRIHPRTGELTFVPSYISPDRKTLTASISGGGVYSVEIDTLAPAISDPVIDQWRHNHQYYLTVKVEDDLSGIDYRSAEFLVNDVRGIAEYDPEKNILRYHLPGFTPKQENDLTVRLSDRAGNTVEKTFTGVPYN